MSLQSKFNNDAILMLKKTTSFILANKDFKDNAIAISLREISNSSVSISDMTTKQLDSFDTDLVSTLICRKNCGNDVAMKLVAKSKEGQNGK